MLRLKLKTTTRGNCSAFGICDLRDRSGTVGADKGDEEGESGSGRTVGEVCTGGDDSGEGVFASSLEVEFDFALRRFVGLVAIRWYDMLQGR